MAANRAYVSGFLVSANNPGDTGAIYGAQYIIFDGDTKEIKTPMNVGQPGVVGFVGSQYNGGDSHITYDTNTNWQALVVSDLQSARHENDPSLQVIFV